MNIYTIYSGDRIKRILGCPEEALSINIGENELFINGWFDSEFYYIQDGEAKLRPEIGGSGDISAYVDENIILLGAPAETKIYIDGVLVGETISPDPVLSFPLGMTYYVRLEPPFPYKEKHIKVIVYEV
jgi:hypothetical protein